MGAMSEVNQIHDLAHTARRDQPVVQSAEVNDSPQLHSESALQHSMDTDQALTLGWCTNETNQELTLGWYTATARQNGCRSDGKW